MAGIIWGTLVWFAYEATDDKQRKDLGSGYSDRDCRFRLDARALFFLLDEGSTLAGQPASRRPAQWSADRAPLRPGEWWSCDDESEYAAGVGDRFG